VSHPPLRRMLGICLLVAALFPARWVQDVVHNGAVSAQAPLPGEVVGGHEDPPALPPPQSTEAQNTEVRDPFFGIVQAIHGPEMAVAAGASWERVVVWWSSFQPNGSEEWVEGAWPPRHEIEAQRARGIEVVGVVLHTPLWAAREDGDPAVSPPYNLELPFDDPRNYWGQFMARLAREYAGAIDTWIVWNEPEFCWTGTVAEFAQLQKVAYLAVKAANPDARVILTGTTYWMDHERGRPLFLERLLAELAKESGSRLQVAGSGLEGDGGGAAVAGAEQAAGSASQPAASADSDPCDLQPEICHPSFYFDAVAVHQYGNPLNCFAMPVLYRRILESFGLDKPIWLPESNVVPHDDPLKTLTRGALRATMEEQASYMIQSAALARAAGVERYAVYKMRDEEPENDQYYGLARNDGTPRPAYTAYQVAIREMSGAVDAQYFWSGSASPPTEDEITALLASTSSRAQFVWPGAMNGVRMRRGDDRVTVLWNVTAAPLEIGVPSSVETATLIDKHGETLPLERAEDGAFHLMLAAATNNTDARDSRLILVGGDPVILVEPGAAGAPDPYPRPVDACWGVPGALVPSGPLAVVSGQQSAGGDAAGEGAEGLQAAGEGLGATATAEPDACHLEPATCDPSAGDVAAGETDGGSPLPEPESAEEVWFGVTGYAVSGPWLGFFSANGGVDVLGYPRSPVVADPLDGTRCVQYFQRAVLEWRVDGPPPADNPPGYRIERRLLGALLGEAAPPMPPSAPNGPDYWYFAADELYPFGEGLGHAVSNEAPDGTDIGFKEYFDRYGGPNIFGYPMEPPTRRMGPDGVERWTQRFQAAMFEYHAEFDINGAQPDSGVPWRNWRVQLALLGDEYLRAEGLPFVSGDAAKHVPRPPEPTP
jgi:hypothetical protein